MKQKTIPLITAACLALSPVAGALDYIGVPEIPEEMRETLTAAEAEKQAPFDREMALMLLRALASSHQSRSPDIHLYSPGPRVYIPQYQYQPQRITPFTCSRVGNFVNCY